MKHRWALVAAILLAAHAGVEATPYWIAWEGDDWPENQGWRRDILGGGDVRTLENGVMTLDGLDTGPGFVWDAYEWFRPGSMDPDPGETFVMQWRLRVDALSGGNWDPIVFVHSDDARAVSFEFSRTSVWSTYEGSGAQVQVTPDVFQAYELRSSDMRLYQLFIDGELRRVGSFASSVNPTWLGWGDGLSVTRSVSVWDYFRFGVVPEPAGACPLVLAVMAARVRRVR